MQTVDVVVNSVKPVFVALLISVSLSAHGEYTTPSPGVLKVANSTYPRVKVGEHVVHIPIETIVSDLDFFLRVFGHLEELLARPDSDPYTIERHRVAYGHFIEVLSNLRQSRKTGALAGTSLDKQARFALLAHHFVAFRYFLNEWFKIEYRDEIHTWLSIELKNIYDAAKPERYRSLKADLDSFHKEVGTYQELLDKCRAKLTTLESAARQLFEKIPQLAEIPAETQDALKQLRYNILRNQKQLSVTREALIQKGTILAQQVEKQHRHAEICRFICEIIAEYSLTPYPWLEQDDKNPLQAEAAPSVLKEAVPGLTIPQWRFLEAHTREATVNSPTHRFQNDPDAGLIPLRPPLVKPQGVISQFFGLGSPK